MEDKQLNIDDNQTISRNNLGLRSSMSGFGMSIAPAGV
jgi:hypothetical protein